MSAERRAVAPEAPAAAAEASCAAGIAPAPETACEAGTAPAAEAPAADPSRRAAVFFVGNRLMMDDGVAPAAFDLMLDTFEDRKSVV